MILIHLHYDGWLALPEAARRHLQVFKGDRVEVELIEGGLVLRSVGSGTAATLVVSPSGGQAVAAAQNFADAPRAKRGPGRPRKIPVQDLAPIIKVGGRRKTIPVI